MKRPLDLAALRLSPGAHAEGEDMCVMEAVAYASGEDWSDRPGSVSPVIRELVRGLNDAMDDRGRQTLKPLITLLAGTRSHEKVEAARSWMVMDWQCRAWPSAWLRAAGCIEEAAALDSRPPIVDGDTLQAVLQPLARARASAAARRAATMAIAVDETLETALAACRANRRDPVIAAAEAAIKTRAGWPAMRAAEKAVPSAAGWDAERSSRWRLCWDAAGGRMSVAAETGQIAAMRAVSGTSAWEARWNMSRAGSHESWDAACSDSRSTGRDAALAVSLQAAWAATGTDTDRALWPVAADGAAVALDPTVAALQHDAIALVVGLVNLDVAARDVGRAYVWR